MGTQCCNQNKELTLEDQLNYLDQEETWLRQTIEYKKKKIKGNQENP